MIVMTVSGDRPEYLAETLDSWAAVRGIDDRTVGFVVEPGAELARCREVIGEFAADRDAETVAVVNDRRSGVLVNPHRALTWAFTDRRAEFVVLAEEDIVVSDDVLEYLDDRAAAHAADPAVLAVCAFSRLDGPQPADAVGSGPFSPWVWGTWADRWSGLLADRWFSAARAPVDGAGSGFDFGVERLATEGDLRFVVPFASRSDNIGQYGGVHALPEDFAASRATTFLSRRAPVRFVERDLVGT